VPACAPGSAEVVIDRADVPGPTTTLALELFAGSTTLVAVTVKFVLLETLGAVNMPVLETVPDVADQVTAVLLVPCTRAVNCWLLPEVRLAAFGETDTDTLATAGVTVTEERANLVASATLVAVMVAVVDAVTLGAVNIPPLLIVPLLAVQTTAVFAVLVTVAVNCCVPAEVTVDEVGETTTLTGTVSGFTVIVDCACLLESAALVAITVAVVGAVTLGAVNIPLLVIVPLLAVHTTAVFEVFLTVAVNCCVPAEMTLDEVGETVTLTGTVSGFTVIVDCERLFGSATLVAVTVAVVGTVTLGAVNIPLLVIVPVLAVQVTAGFAAWATVAENCCVPADARMALLGETETVIAGLSGLTGFTIM
jgi:hypothetical protein